MHTLITPLVVALALASPTAAVATPSLDTVPTRPTITRAVAAGHAVALPARVCSGSFSDFQAYSGHTSRAFVRQSIESDGIVWATRSGRAVASLAWDDCTVRALSRRPITFGAWQERTR